MAPASAHPFVGGVSGLGWRFAVNAVAGIALMLPVSAQQAGQATPNQLEDTNYLPDTTFRGATPDAPSQSRRLDSATAFSFPAGYQASRSLTYSRLQSFSPQNNTSAGSLSNAPVYLSATTATYGNPYVTHISRYALAQSIRYGIASADGESTAYHQSQDSGLFSRAQHAFLETFTSQTAGGARIPALSLFAGAYGAAFLTNTYYPDPRASFALERGTAALGSSLGVNLLQELVPHKYYKALHLRDPREQR